MLLTKLRPLPLQMWRRLLLEAVFCFAQSTNSPAICAVHLDIAGMAFSKYAGALNSGGATGYGVRLLNKLVEDYYE